MKVKEEGVSRKFKEEMLKESKLPEEVQEWWEHNRSVIKKVGEEVLGRTSGK